jgi:macrophage erythroblast attacher
MLLTLAQDQPLLRLPFELSRNNFRTAHRQIEQSQNKVQELVQAATRASTASGASKGDGPHPSLHHIDAALTRLQTLKRKLTALDEAQVGIQEQSAARIQHLDELYGIHTLVDVKYEEWSRTRLDRLLVDYLLRKGYTASARELATEKGIEKLVDVEEFETSMKIERSLRQEQRVDVALAWCGENKANLKKINVRSTPKNNRKQVKR